MTTEILKINDPNDRRIENAAEILRRGGLVVFPTETVYGLGADARNKAAAQAIYAAKGRPSDNPLIIHVARAEDAELYAETNKYYYDLAKKFMPGPLTVILPRKSSIPPETAGGLDTIAVRCPSHPIARSLITAANLPIAAPSANLSGRPSPTNADDVIADMNGRVDMIIDGGECEIGLESTIVKLEEDRGILLRPGAVTVDALLCVLPKVDIAPAVIGKLAENELPLSPGMKYRHYAPDAPLVLLDGEENAVLQFMQNAPQNSILLCYDEEISSLSGKRLLPVGKRNDLAKQAKALFSSLREADRLNAEIIYAHLPPTDGLGLALYNRMLRAAAHTIKNVSEE
ncbi:MAG: threonylcarbamoyl-AMP synthase [Ruminococcaceae bacterium]|nr:threonylcarbamoyl-AMP synthase [Oscillospiraceae bacterium]